MEIRSQRRSRKGLIAALCLLLVGGAAAVEWTVKWVWVWVFLEDHPAVFSGVLAAVGLGVAGAFALRGRGRTSADSGTKRICPRCGYDMTALSGRLTCPECGLAAACEGALRPRPGHRWGVGVGLGLALGGVLAPTMLAVGRNGWAAGLPDWLLAEWVLRIDGLPQAVRTELSRRTSGNAEAFNAWSERMHGRVEDVSARAMSALPGDRDFYIEMLPPSGLSARAFDRAVAALRGSDPARREGALVLLADVCARRAGERASVPIEPALPFLEDVDQRTATRARWLVLWQADAMLHAVAGDASGPGTVRDAATMVLYLRALLSVPVDLDGWETLERLSTHYDARVADHAAVLMALSSSRRGGPPPSVLRRAVLARARLENAGVTLPACGRLLSLAGTPGFERVVALVDDPDPAVRRGLSRQLTADLAAEAGGDGRRTLKGWLPALRGRLERELDAGVRASLSGLIECIGGHAEAARP